MDKQTAVWMINGSRCDVVFLSGQTLLHVLRDAGHTEVKAGCETGECGSCVVLLNGKPVNSCQVLAFTVGDQEITTISGIGTIHQPHPIQEAMAELAAVQCGFCTPGLILSTYALLTENSDPTEDEIRKALDGNICRCAGYSKILAAVKDAARRMKHNG